MSAEVALERAFLAWAQNALVPIPWQGHAPKEAGLGALDAVTGGAKVVALSEPVHGAAEPLELRNAWFQHLSQRGFTAIALESGSIEGRVLYDYVLSGDPSEAALSKAVSEGFSWTFDRLPQNTSLVRWLREHNARAGAERPVRIYGFDLSGSPGTAEARRGVDTALAAALDYLIAIDPEVGQSILHRLGTLRASVRFSPQGAGSAPDYSALAQADREVITCVIADLVSWLENRAVARPTVRASHDEVDSTWAIRAARDAQHIDQWLRQLPLSWQSGPGGLESLVASDFFRAMSDIRSRAQADHVEGLLQQEGPRGRVLLFASRMHVSRTPVRVHFARAREQQVMGCHLRERLGAQFLSIGMLTRAGSVYTFADDSPEQTLQPPAEDSIEALLSTLGVCAFLLDLRSAPEPIARWLAQPRRLGVTLRADGRDALELPIGRAYDLILYLDTVSSALRNRNPIHA